MRTAGGGGSAGGSDSAGKVGESMHEATFRGVDEAELIRSAISARVRAQRGAGLGDPDEAVGSQGVFDPRLTAAAVRLRQETSALRGALRELLARP